jgi:hypothetical protein
MDKAGAIIVRLNTKRSKPVFKVKFDKPSSFIFLAESIRRALISCRKSDNKGWLNDDNIDKGQKRIRL